MLAAFLRNIRLILFVMGSMFGIMVCTAGQLYLLGWNIGVVEAVCLSMLLGLAVCLVCYPDSAYPFCPFACSLRFLSSFLKVFVQHTGGLLRSLC